jgi:glycosyltransferase involved in cell wall biosynthesis/precorrin-6B methylase 2
MPVFNEEKTIKKSISEVLKHEFINQLVVVNDGSTDSTSQIISNISDPRVKIIEQSKNKGKGYALRVGFENAIGPYVGVQDADMEYDPADLKKLLAPLEKGLADAVFGSRFISSDAHRVLYFWHSVGNRFLTTLSNMFTNLNLTDMETCYKIIRKDILQEIDLRENRFGFEPEITAKLASLGVRIYEVGISYSGRTYQEGKKIGWKDGFRAIYVIAKYGSQGRKKYKRLKKLEIQQNVDLAPQMGLENLASLDNYNKWIYRKFKNFLGGSILDIGSGSGNLAKLFAEKAENLTLLEPSPIAFSNLKTLAEFSSQTVKLQNSNIEEFINKCDQRFDTITLTNVLEHIKNHKGILTALRPLLAPGGNLIIFVPAFEVLYSNFDFKIGHFRRYRKKSLKKILESTGYELVQNQYFNFVGFFGWFLFARILRGDPTKSRFVKTIDKYVVPILENIENKLVPPFGQSLFVVAKVKDTNQ